MRTFAARSGPSSPGPQPWPRRCSCEPVTRERDVCGLGPVPAALGSAASASWRARGVAVVLTSSSFSFSSDSQRQMGVQSKAQALYVIPWARPIDLDRTYVCDAPPAARPAHQIGSA